jgi:hypothetical protein
VVVVAAVITIVLCALSVLVLLLAVVGVVAAHVDPDGPADAIGTTDMVLALSVIAVALGVSTFAIVLAGLALGRRQWARITLAVLGFVAAVVAFWLVGVAMIVDGVEPSTSAGEVVGGAVLCGLGLLPAGSSVLLLLPRARRWYRGRPDAAVPPPAIG